MAGTDGRITRRDVEEKIRALTGGVSETAQEARPTLVGTAAGVAVVLLLVAYLLGRRSGRHRSAVVEIRRA